MLSKRGKTLTASSFKTFEYPKRLIVQMYGSLHRFAIYQCHCKTNISDSTYLSYFSVFKEVKKNIASRLQMKTK